MSNVRRLLAVSGSLLACLLDKHGGTTYGQRGGARRCPGRRIRRPWRPPQFNPDDTDPLPSPVVELRRRLHEADAVLFSVPEYAGAMPGSFKNLLDWCIGDDQPGSIAGKPVVWINASPRGAANAHDSLRMVLGYASAAVIEPACAEIAVTGAMVGEDGLIADPSARHRIVDALTTLANHDDGGDPIGSVSGGSGRPVSRPSAVIAGAAHQAGSCHQKPITDGAGAGLLAGDLCGSVLVLADVIVGGRLDGRPGLVRPGLRVRRVDVARRDVGPVPGPAGQRSEGAADHSRLPRHLDDGVPAPVTDRAIRSRLAPVGRHQSRTVGDRTTLPPGQAGHRVPTPNRPAGHRSSQPGRSPEDRISITEVNHLTGAPSRLTIGYGTSA